MVSGKYMYALNIANLLVLLSYINRYFISFIGKFVPFFRRPFGIPPMKPEM